MKQDVLDYLRYTPANTNVNVVSTMLGSDGGGEELPEEVKNAILTHGMGWTDDDGTINKIDEKYIYGEEDVIIKMAECDIIQPIASQSNKLFINNDDKIFIF